jgi:hypothetical protein
MAFLDFLVTPGASNQAPSEFAEGGATAPTDARPAPDNSDVDPGLGYTPSMGIYNGSLDNDEGVWGTVSMSGGVAVINGAGTGSLPPSIPVVDMKADPYFKTTFVSPELSGVTTPVDDNSPNPVAERTTWEGQTEWVDLRENRTNSLGN